MAAPGTSAARSRIRQSAYKGQNGPVDRLPGAARVRLILSVSSPVPSPHAVPRRDPRPRGGRRQARATRPRGRASPRPAAGTRRAPCGWPRRSSGWPRSPPTWSSPCCGSSYPFPLEYLESNSLVEVQRILAGHALYAAPAVGYVPDGYPPLYFATSAAAASVLGLSYLPLRLVSLVSSLACFAVLARLVQRETASAAAGIAAAGLLAATYFVTDTWFDVARVDSLFIALSVAALYAARWMRRTRGRRRHRAAARGRVPHQAERARGRGRGAHRAGVRPAAAARLDRRADLRRGPRDQHAGARAREPRLVRVLRLRADERAHPEVRRLRAVLDRATCCPCSASPAAPWCWGRGGRPWCWSPGAPRWSSRATPRWSTAAAGQRPAARVPRGGAARRAGDGRPARRPGGRRARTGWPAARIAGWRPGLAGRWVAAAAAALVIAQLAVLVNGFHPGRAIPTSADRAVGWRLMSGMRAFGGTIAVPSDPGLDLLAGLPAVAHQGATDDVLRASDPAGTRELPDAAPPARWRRGGSARS